MKVTMLLADSAQAVDGKLYILGGGWSITGPDPTPMAIALKIDVPWHEANNIHKLRLALFDEDGQAVMVPTPTGKQPFEIHSSFEVGRPPGLKPGTLLDLALAINLPAVSLHPNSRFVWRCFIDDATTEDWQVGFSTRPQSTPTPG
jgi:hypothetical protein